MKENKYLKKDGTIDEIENSLVEKVALNKANADLLFSIIQDNRQLLSSDEYFIDDAFNLLEHKENKRVFSMMVYNQKYHINIKYATIALICLIFDIAISKGFASFVVSLFGVDYSLVKLDDFEKCIAFRLKTKKALSLDELYQFGKCDFSNYNVKCGNLSDDGLCSKWEKDIVEEAVKSLVDKKVIKYKGDKYVLVL